MNLTPPSALSQHTVRLILVYISQSLPLPPHLLSKPLLQRHYFLHITPDDYLAYLAWPGSSPQFLADVLNGLSSPPDDQHAGHTIVYSSDQETTLAHVSIAPADAAYNSLFRLVLMWDNGEAMWKYHNLAPMPFPQGSVPSVDQAMSQPSFDQPEIDADSYWGTPDHSDEVCDHDPEPQSDSEDDYWARYSIVQGQYYVCGRPSVSNLAQVPAILCHLPRHGRANHPGSMIELWYHIPRLKSRSTIL